MKRGWIVSLVVGLVCAGAAGAAVRKGDTELEFLGGWFEEDSVDGDSDLESLFASATLNFFLTDSVQVGISGFGTSIEIGNGDLDIYGVGGKVKYHFFPANPWVPYVGLQVFWAHQEGLAITTGDGKGQLLLEDGEGLLWGPVAGLRFELTPSNDFFVEYQYHIWRDDIGDVLDDGQGLFLGIVHQFK